MCVLVRVREAIRIGTGTRYVDQLYREITLTCTGKDAVLTFEIQQQFKEKLVSRVTRFDCTSKRLITRIKRVEELVARE